MRCTTLPVLLLALLAAARPDGAAAFDPWSTIGLYGDNEPADEDVAGFPRGNVTRAYIPDRIDLTPLMPPPVEQKEESCVAFATGYAALGYYLAMAQGVVPAGPDRLTASAAHLHERIRQRDVPCDDAGSNIFLAIRALKGGAVPASVVPHARVCEPGASAGRPDSALAVETGEVLYRRQADGALAQGHLDLIKQTLAAGHPVLASLLLYEAALDGPGEKPTSLAFLTADDIYQGSLAPHGELAGGHAVVLVAYDERRQVFLLQNSWGPGWAGGGFGWISYDAVRADMRYALRIVPRTETQRPVPGLSRERFAAEIGGTLEGVPLDPCSSIERIGDLGFSNDPLYAGFVATREEMVDIAATAITRRHLEHSLPRIAVRPWPVCEALKTLAPAVHSPIRPTVRMLGEDTTIPFEGSLAFSVTTPTEAATFLYIVYLDASGGVTNLTPRRGPIREQHPPGTTLVFGDGREGRQRYTAGPPAGDEAIVVIAARSPVAELEDMEEGAAGALVMDAAGTAADNRHWLSRIREGMADRPDLDALPREVGAAVLHITVTPGG